MAKKQTVTKTLRAAPSSDTLAQWISQGQASSPPFLDDSTAQRPNEPLLRVVKQDEPAPPRERSRRASKAPAPSLTVAANSMVNRKQGPRRQVTYYIGPQRALELKIRAVERGSSMAAIVGELIEAWLSAPDALELADEVRLGEDKSAVSGPALAARADGSYRYRINAYLEPEQATRFKIAALRLGREMSELVDGMVALELAR